MKTKTDFNSIYEHIRTIDGWLSRREAFLLYSMASKLPRRSVIVEIGSYKGKSTLALGAGATVSGSHVYTIDPHEGIIRNGQKKGPSTYGDLVENLESAGLSAVVTPLVNTSVAAAADFRQPADFLFIDGLHDYDHAHEDFTVWFPKVKTGGTVAFHDAYGGYPGVYKAAEEALLSPEDFSELGLAGSILYGRKRKQLTFREKMASRSRKNLIRLGQSVYETKTIPAFLRFFVSHRLIKALLFITRKD